MHKISPKLKNLHDIDSWSSVDVAIRGAHYHSFHITKLLDKYDEDCTQFSVSQMNWLIRGFFWELVGAFDLILQWSNKRFYLEVEECKKQVKTGKWKPIAIEQVKWSKVQAARATNEIDLWKQVAECLEQAWKSVWYFEVRTYRNFAHKSLFDMTGFVRTDGKGGSQWFISLAREGQVYEDLRILLPNYIKEFKQLVDKLKDLAEK